MHRERNEEEENSPSKIVKSDRYFSEKKERREPEESMSVLGERVQKMESKINEEKQDVIKMILFFAVLLLLGYFIATFQSQNEVKEFARQLQQLQIKSQEWQREVTHLQDIVTSLRDQLDLLRRYSDKLANEIIDIHINELSKPEKSMPFLQKYSSPIPIELQRSQYSFKKNYKTISDDKKHLKKTTQQEIIAYTTSPVSREGISYFSVRIEQSDTEMISIGLFTETKLKKGMDCGYCQRSEMYYIFCSNGYIYHGETIFIQNSKKSRISMVKKGDVITVFVDRQEDQIVWYVNGRYAETQFLELEADLYPFVLMSSRGDEVVFLT